MTASSSQRRDEATARVHQAQGTQNRLFRDRKPEPPWPRHPEPEGDWDRRSLLHATTWPPAQDITVSHCDCLALVGQVQWSPQTEEQGRGLRLHHKARDKSKGQPTPAPGKRATEKHSMEYPKRLVEAQTRTKSAFRKETRTSDVRRSSTEPQPSSEDPERHPRKGDKLDRTPAPQEITRAA